MAPGRICAREAGELETMIGKMLAYEREPIVDSLYYAHPVFAGGWQTERWFILCCEVLLGHQANALGKEPVREYAIYSGSPGSVWSTNVNTPQVVDYFGPAGLGYIPEAPNHLVDWGGSAARLNADLNAGDALGFAFSNCQNDDTEVIDGSVNVVMTRIDGGAQLTGFAGRMTLTALSGRALDGRHAYTVNGALLTDFRQTSPTSETLRLTTDGEVVANVQTHRFTDTVTLLAGYVNDSSYDSVQMRGSNAFNGSFRSTAAGGPWPRWPGSRWRPSC